MLSAAVYKLSR